jgi:molecular chaperone DnaJ
VTCGHCGGRGQVFHSQGFFSVSTSCPRCRGTGREIKEKCAGCGGHGRGREKRKLKVKIPPGVDTGSRVRLAGEGEGGERGGSNGDLFVEIYVKPDPRFARDGQDIVSNITVTLPQAALGTRIEIETLKGREFVDIPRGTQPGDRIRLAGQGFPSLKGYSRGDYFIEVNVQIPKKLTRRQEELMREFAAISDDVVNRPVAGFFERFKRRGGDPSNH